MGLGRERAWGWAGNGGDEAPLPKNHQEWVPLIVLGTVSVSPPFILPSQSFVQEWGQVERVWEWVSYTRGLQRA